MCHDKSTAYQNRKVPHVSVGKIQNEGCYADNGRLRYPCWQLSRTAAQAGTAGERVLEHRAWSESVKNEMDAKTVFSSADYQSYVCWGNELNFADTFIDECCRPRRAPWACFNKSKKRASRRPPTNGNKSRVIPLYNHICYAIRNGALSDKWENGCDIKGSGTHNIQGIPPWSYHFRSIHHHTKFAGVTETV